ncbi:MAG: branched-chain amino acid ABC transporter ATP-binding protein, partial [Desulfobacterales bacterium]|nr:branched-chain amino acid ABC transporter ATP-binding protein [Desulfobacterales bacterium]
MVAEITRIIDDIKNGGLTVLLVEQNASLALGLADTGYVLETGRMALQGESRELVKNEHVRKAYLGG